jgi:hypothetical protein
VPRVAEKPAGCLCQHRLEAEHDFQVQGRPRHSQPGWNAGVAVGPIEDDRARLRAAIAEPAANSAEPAINSRRRPNMSARRPAAISSDENGRWKAMTVHCSSAIEVWNSPWMIGNATTIAAVGSCTIPAATVVAISVCVRPRDACTASTRAS